MHRAEAKTRVSAVGFVKPVMMVRHSDLAVLGLLSGIIGMSDKGTLHMIVKTTPRNGYKRRTFFNIEQSVIRVHRDTGADFTIQLAMIDPGVLDVIERQRIIRVGYFMDF